MNKAKMIHYLNKEDRSHHIVILTGLIIFMTAVTGICNRIPVWELLLFIGFQILCVMLPGMAAMELTPIKNLRGIERVTLVYTFGYMLTMIVYAALMITVGREYVRIGFLLLAVLSCVVFALKRKQRGRLAEEVTEETKNGIWIGTVLAVFLVSLIVFSMRWKIPYAAGANNYESDFLYWAGDIVALKKQFPPKEFRTLNPIYRYHYFGALQQAAVSAVTGIQAVKVAVCYSYIEGAVLVGLASYALVSRMIRNKAAQVLALLLMLFATGYEETASVTYIWHMYQVPMSYHIAQALGIIVVVLLLAQLENKRIDICNLAWSLCCMVCCMGTKSTSGAVVFCGVALMYLYLLLSRSSKRIACIAMGAMALVFGAAAIYLWPSVKAFNLVMNLPDLHFGSVAQVMRNIYICASWLGGYITEIVTINFWVFIPAGVYSLYLIICKKITKEQILFLIIIAIGTMADYVIEFNGNSQMYFCLITFPFAAVLAGGLLETVFQRCLSQKMQYIAVGLLSVGLFAFLLRYNYKEYFGYNAIMGLKNVITPRMAEEGECLLGVSQAECEAYCWILENTDEDVILLSGRSLENIHDPTTVFSERYAYVPHDYLGGDYLRVRRCFMGDQEAVRYYAELGLDYIVQRKFHTPLLQCPADVGEVAFENDEVRIYRLFWGQKGKTGVFY